MAPETPNPFQPPETRGSMQQSSVRPNIFDWFFAIFLGLLAAAFVFPTTCFGSFMVILLAEPLFMTGNNNLLVGVLVYGLLIACVVLTIFSAMWVARYYVKFVRKNAAKYQEPESQEP